MSAGLSKMERLLDSWSIGHPAARQSTLAHVILVQLRTKTFSVEHVLFGDGGPGEISVYFH